VWRNIDFFYEKSQRTLSWNGQHNEAEVNLPISGAQRPFGPAIFVGSVN
jgi:hypothetical protein